MRQLRETDLVRGRNVVLVGQGRSSWLPKGGPPLEFNDVGGSVLVVCNRRWMDENLIRRVDIVAAADVPQVRDLVEERIGAPWIAVPEEHLQTIRLMDGVVAANPDRMLRLPLLPGGSCTGATVFRAILEAGARSVTLIGFDGGTGSTENFYAGSHGYEVGPAQRTFQGWDQRMAWDAREHPLVELHHVRIAGGDRSALADVATTHEVQEGGEGWRVVQRIEDGRLFPSDQSSPVLPL